MKEFAVGAVAIAIVTGVFCGMMAVMQPIGMWAERQNNRGKGPSHSENYHAYQGPAVVAVVLTVALMIGFGSSGIGAGVLRQSKERTARKAPNSNSNERRLELVR